MTKERELLERAYYVLSGLSYAILKDSGDYNLAGDIYEYRAELTQDEPVDVSAKSGPTIAAMLPNGVAVSNVYEAYEAGLKEGKLQDEGLIDFCDTHCTWLDHHPSCPLKEKYGGKSK